MANNKGSDNPPEFAVVDVRSTDPVKDGKVWNITASALIKNRSNKPPEPSKQVIFLVNSSPTGTPRDTDEYGRAQIDIVLHKPGRYYLEAQIVGTSFTRGTTATIEGDKDVKKIVHPHIIRTSESNLEPGKCVVHFVAKDAEGKPLKGAVVEVLDGALPNGRCKLQPTNESGLTSYTMEFKDGETERRFSYCSGNVHQTKRVWR